MGGSPGQKTLLENDSSDRGDIINNVKVSAAFRPFSTWKFAPENGAKRRDHVGRARSGRRPGAGPQNSPERSATWASGGTTSTYWFGSRCLPMMLSNFCHTTR